MLTAKVTLGCVNCLQHVKRLPIINRGLVKAENHSLTIHLGVNFLSIPFEAYQKHRMKQSISHTNRKAIRPRTWSSTLSSRYRERKNDLDRTVSSQEGESCQRHHYSEENKSWFRGGST